MRKAHKSVSLFWIKDEIAAAFEKGTFSIMKPPLITCERVLVLSVYLVSAVFKTWAKLSLRVFGDWQAEFGEDFFHVLPDPSAVFR